ncbi:MAG: peptidoglycan DD-metalloendopeptidase family protein [Xanthomonadaceae bacterium]|nr:peptidoglycan DD-metalloendopeptidase family protein [Xanthomonadaceae bacterium]
MPATAIIALVRNAARRIVPALAFLALASNPAWADEKEADAERKLADVRARIATLTEQQRAIAAERGETEDELRQADGRVSEAVRRLRGTEAELAQRESTLARLRTEHEALSSHLSGQREALAALVRSAYALGRHEQLKLLLAQDRIADLARVMAYHRYLQADRSERIQALLDQLRTLAELSAKVEEERAALAIAKDAQQADIAALEARRGERKALLTQLDARQRDARQQLATLGRDEQALTRLLEQLRDVLADIPRRMDEGIPLAQRQGALPWPVVGPLLTGFGGRLGDGRTARGWLIAGTAGAEVRAISHGRVAFADWMKGYGLILILDHGDGWLSLYAHNDALLKNAGDWVGAGEPIASLGNSGGLDRPALYFELRRAGAPVDPKVWLRKR